MNSTFDDWLHQSVTEAVSHYWATRSSQSDRQEQGGAVDQGKRSAVTGGAQMDGFTSLLSDIVMRAGIPASCVFVKKNLELPGYFRPTKEWDLLVVKGGHLIAAIEAKSQVGPSFGNNFNNRTEEAMGSALDLWTAYREGAFLGSPQPFLGYLFMLEKSVASQQPVRVKQPHFSVDEQFVGASYSGRYELFCRRLVLERHYTAAAFLMAPQEDGIHGRYECPTADLSINGFARSLFAHVSRFGG